MKTTSQAKRRAPGTQLVALVLMLIVWEIATRALDIVPDKLPRPSAVLETIAGNRMAFAWAVGTTVFEALLGFVAGVAFGVIAGVAFSRYRLLERMMMPYFAASQAVPIIAFGTIIVIWFGNGIASKAVIALYLSFFPVAVNTLAGIRRVSADETGLLKTFGASDREIFWKLLLPSALPSIFTAIRVSIGLALVGAIVGEWFGARTGLGVILMTAMYDQQIEQLWAAILLTGLSGTAMFAAVVALQRAVIPWYTET